MASAFIPFSYEVDMILRIVQAIEGTETIVCMKSYEILWCSTHNFSPWSMSIVMCVVCIYKSTRVVCIRNIDLAVHRISVPYMHMQHIPPNATALIVPLILFLKRFRMYVSFKYKFS